MDIFGSAIFDNYRKDTRIQSILDKYTMLNYSEFRMVRT